MRRRHARGQPEGSAGRAQHSPDLYCEVGDRLGEARASLMLTNALAKIGDRTRAKALYRDALAYAEPFEMAPLAREIRAAMQAELSPSSHR